VTPLTDIRPNVFQMQDAAQNFRKMGNGATEKVATPYFVVKPDAQAWRRKLTNADIAMGTWLA